MLAHPGLLLRIEGAVVLIAALVGYAHLGGSWGWFIALFLLPDISMLGYLRNPKLGASCYNLVHTYITPAMVLFVSMYLHSTAVLYVLIWIAHIGFDRFLGFGLKYPTFFKDTHLGRT